MKAIYPNIDIEMTSNGVRCTTYIRKKHTDGKWYLIFLVSNYQCSATEAFKQFVANIYMIQLFSYVIPKSEEKIGIMPHELDEDQRDEEERLKRTI